MKSSNHKRDILNQLINLFWTAVCFTPVLWYWMKTGIGLYFYLFIAVALLMAILPARLMDRLTFSSRRRFYESLGVKSVRRLVQNGDLVKKIGPQESRAIIHDVSQARKYLSTIAMYERFHWACATFFLLTAIVSFGHGYLMWGLLITAANLLYNFSSILLQQYNKLRIKKLIGGSFKIK